MPATHRNSFHDDRCPVTAPTRRTSTFTVPHPIPDGQHSYGHSACDDGHAGGRPAQQRATSTARRVSPDCSSVVLGWQEFGVTHVAACIAGLSSLHALRGMSRHCPSNNLRSIGTLLAWATLIAQLWRGSHVLGADRGECGTRSARSGRPPPKPVAWHVSAIAVVVLCRSTFYAEAMLMDQHGQESSAHNEGTSPNEWPKKGPCNRREHRRRVS
jgi:hypothetical protein